MWFCLPVYLCAVLAKCLSEFYALLAMLIVTSKRVVKHECRADYACSLFPCLF